MAAPFEGGCRCKAVRYRGTAEPVVTLHCYCRDCQYASGGAGATAFIVTSDSVTVEGTPAAFSVEADSGVKVSRYFCQQCGSPLFSRNPMVPGLFAIKAATLDDPSWLAPAAHIWTRSAPPWACITEGLARFPRNFGAPEGGDS